jgi:hypothetical protein
VDDIWLPLFSVVATCFPEVNLDPKQDSLLGDLARIAKQPITMPQQNPISGDRSSPRFAQLPSTDTIAPEQPNVALQTAVQILAWECPIEPTELARRVSKRIDAKVTAQWLGKNLRRYGISAKKTFGRRIFRVEPGELERVRAKLGIPSPIQSDEGGQQGQEGREGHQPAEQPADLI